MQRNHSYVTRSRIALSLPASSIRALVFKLTAIAAVTVIAFSIAFFVLCKVSPSNGLTNASDRTPFECLYFSVVTLSTLGYGDIAPLGWSRTIASAEAIFGLIFFGYSISQAVSAKQELQIDYLARSQIVEIYEERIYALKDAKEILGDRRRSLQARVPVVPTDFLYNRDNPFYPALVSIERMLRYTQHIVDMQQTDLVREQITLAAHHVEELAGFINRYLRLLEHNRAQWRTHRTHWILSSLVTAIDTFERNYSAYSSYGANEKYKGGAPYPIVLKNLIMSIKNKLAGPLVAQVR